MRLKQRQIWQTPLKRRRTEKLSGRTGPTVDSSFEPRRPKGPHETGEVASFSW